MNLYVITILWHTNNSLCNVDFFIVITNCVCNNDLQNVEYNNLDRNKYIPFMTVLRKNNRIYYATFFNVIKFCLFFILIFLLLQLNYFHILFNEFFLFYLFPGIRMD